MKFPTILFRAGLLALLLLQGPGVQAEALDSDAIRRMVIEEARRNGTVPPSIALGVAKVESGFRANVESHKGARGVMQIMPATAAGEFGRSADELWDPRTNIRLGVAYLERLYRQYGNRWDAALSHYNGGTLRGGRGSAARPHGYTRRYVADVLAWSRRFAHEDAAVSLAAAEAALDRRTASRPTAGTVGAPAPYWIFDEPGVERNWRDYLKAADHWLKHPADIRLPAGERSSMQDIWAPTTAAVPVLGADPRPASQRLRRDAEELRRGILNRVNEAPGRLPSTSIRPRFG